MATFIDSATGNSYTTGSGGVITGASQSPGGSNINPMTGTSFASPSQGFNAANYLNDYNTKYNDMLGAQRSALEQIYNARVGQIGDSYNSERQGIQDVGGRIAGSLRRTLGRAGAFTTTAGGEAQVNQEQSVQNQIVKLGAARDDALAQALAAKQTGMADLYEKSLNNMYNFQRDMIALQQREQDKLDAKNEKASDFANQLALGGYTKLTPSELSKLKPDQIQKFANGDIYKKPNDIKTSIETIGGGKYLLSYDTQGNIKKIYIGPSGSGSGDAEINKMYKDITDTKDRIMKGGDWGSGYNMLVSKYGGQYDIFDKLLGGGKDPNTGEYWGWAKPGAYQEFINSTQKNSGSTFDSL